eukprot:CAMPEP_0197049398 /NCGR_PEP_ID=MMETSP1384-20130603/24559_1 /TAXON_ID=29189 /ORGANISM="Ammonia sp." /LENGTH=60 /DNA_ID=CAMNT_0042481665 /DNA_START=52 /DNA_END=234 /DNA_ORIENTATION=-
MTALMPFSRLRRVSMFSGGFMLEVKDDDMFSGDTTAGDINDGADAEAALYVVAARSFLLE